MLAEIKRVVEKLDSLSKNKPIKVISHYDTDGITSAAIFSRALQRWNKKFTMQVIKGLEGNFIKELPEDHILVFLDLASNSMEYIKEKKTEVFILDHHEIVQAIPENVTMINPHLYPGQEIISGAGICYLFARSISDHNKDLASLAIIGMVGDMMERNLGKTYSEILKDSETIVKKGLLLYPSTRPLDKALQYSSGFFIPGVTGSYMGVLQLLRDANLEKTDGRYKALYELDENEMQSLITAIMLRGMNEKRVHEIVGNIYLIKFFNKLEDARELSALINACSRMDQPHISLGLCLGNKKSKEEAEKIYIEYKQHLVAALKYISDSEKITGTNYAIINAKNNIKDTIIGTVASIISKSPTYSKGTMIVALAYNENKIKVSARLAGEEGRNVREVLHRVVVNLGGEVGGHPNAAGCLISKDHETTFIEQLQKELELVKV